MPFGFNGGKPQDTITGIHEAVQFWTPIMLGHQSVRVTERHYAPWVRSRQEQLEADLTNARKQDAVIALQKEVQAGVHGEKGPSNSLISQREFWRSGWESNAQTVLVLLSLLGLAQCEKRKIRTLSRSKHKFSTIS
jgi:hypothetical protein